MATTVPKYALMGNLTVIDEVHNDFPNLFIVENQELERSVYFNSFMYPVGYIPDGWYNTIYCIDNNTLKLWSERLV